MIEDYGFGKKERERKRAQNDSSESMSQEDELLEMVGDLPSMSKVGNKGRSTLPLRS